MATTSSGNPMDDQVLRGKPWSNYIQRTRRRGHRFQRTRGRPARNSQPSETDADWTSHANRMTDAWKLQMTSQVPAFARYSGQTTDADRCHLHRTILAEVRRLPYVRTVPSHRTSDPHRTSGTCLCAAAGLWPCIPLPLTPSWLRLYILPHLLLVRVSIVLAHM